jgi:hypothetical protein
MKITQIILRPDEETILIQHEDIDGRQDTTMVKSGELDMRQNEALSAVLEACRSKMPNEPEPPARDEVEREIAELVGRLESLRRSLDTAIADEKAKETVKADTP